MLMRVDAAPQAAGEALGGQPAEPGVTQSNVRPGVAQVGGTVRAGIRFKLIGAFAGVAGLTVVATAVAFISYNVVGGGLHKIEAESLPGMTHAFALARQVAELSAISASIAAAENADDLDRARGSLDTINGVRRCGAKKKGVLARAKLTGRASAHPTDRCR